MKDILQALGLWVALLVTLGLLLVLVRYATS